MLLFEALYEGDGIVRRGTQHHDIGVGGNDLIGNWVPVGGFRGIGNFVDGRPYPVLFQETFGRLYNRLQVRVLLGRVDRGRWAR